jgi:hypothetical protein
MPAFPPRTALICRIPVEPHASPGFALNPRLPASPSAHSVVFACIPPGSATPPILATFAFNPTISRIAP